MSDPSPSSLAESAGSDLAPKMQRAWAQLRRRDYVAAHKEAAELRAQHPGNRDLLLLIAVSLRHLDRIAEALEILDELEQHHPTYARLFEERGFCHLGRHAAEPAITALERAATLNPWLPVTLRTLGDLYRLCGRPEEAEAAARSSAMLEELPREILTAHTMFADGEVLASERLVRCYLLAHGDHIDGLRLLARIAMAHDVPYDAEILLGNVLRMAPDYHAARYEYAVALLRRLKHQRAREELEKLLATDPDNRDCRLAHATACARLGDDERALTAYQQLLGQTPKDAGLRLAIGHEFKILGRTAEAIQSYRAAAAVRPGFGDAYWSLANLKTYRFEAAELEQMTRYEAETRTTQVDRYHLCFALGKALEDRGEYARSFHYYERGNALKRLECRYRPEFLENIARLQLATCTPEFFAARRGWGYPDAAPIFIVGLPRAGSTLIEQILASHSQVDGTMELPNIAHLVFDLHDPARASDNPPYPGVLAELTRDDCAGFGEQYIRDTRVYRRGKPFFIDKWPENFQDLGFIHLILPNARIIDARRDPMACCFGIFKQLFPSGFGPEFAYTFKDIAGRYRLYLELMRHWNAVLPGKILRVQYEELVTDFPAIVHHILEFCDLKPELACFEFHKAERAVYTPSAEQVRQPLNRAGLDQWRRFEPWLGPLQEAVSEFQLASFDAASNTSNER